ncbi:hypothetical protein [Flavobacterium aciduliphilum]|uniref:50S ribosomal protein L27 n=1 Tax=Flavobacterium aciduliphilum TaxID=1101402 RepID=A0A328YDI0_9FLAO|nr:hypothetical protein [Flavobacterium aciduliphilum]RAR71284.1 hypothetical protein CLV55_10821 [Flavobacterium aciduliphilum]
MDHILQKAHSGWAYLVFLLLILALINAATGVVSKREFTAKDRKIALFGLIATHLQLVFGFVLYFVSPLGKQGLSQMSNAAVRLTALEHPIVNIIAIALITIGWSKHKKTTESLAKFKAITIFYGLGIVFLLSRIPWNLWF